MVDSSDLAGSDPFEILDRESQRCSRFFDEIDEAAWVRDTRCEGWRVREILSHLDGVESYHLACLNDGVKAWADAFRSRGAKDGNDFNDLIVKDRADRSREDLLASWRAANAEVRGRMRELGADGSMSSSVGPYPVGLMAFHICSEYATHADDMDAPIDPAERAGRTAWREKVSLFALKEAEKPVEVEPTDGGYVVRHDGEETTLSAEDFVEAVTARLKTIPPGLQDALRALA